MSDDESKFHLLNSEDLHEEGVRMEEPAIQITVHDSIHWTGKGAFVTSARLPQYIEMLGMATTPLYPSTKGIVDWLRHDTWTQEEGLLLLLGLDPNGTVISQSNWLNAKNERIDEIEKALFLDGREIWLPVFNAVFDYLESCKYQGVDYRLAKQVKHELWNLSESYRQMKAIWDSGNHPARNAPRYFVEWAIGKGYKVEWAGSVDQIECLRMHEDPVAVDAATIAQVEAEQNEGYGAVDEELAISELFDPVTPAALEKMFPSDGRWAKWHAKAKEKGLDAARQGPGKYNPYRAARWWLDKQAPDGWTLGRVFKRLANNLPPRSFGLESRLTGNDEGGIE